MAGHVVRRVAANTRALREDAGMSLSELARRASCDAWRPAACWRSTRSASPKDPLAAATRELVVVQSGRIRVGPVDPPVELGPGDSATYAADKPHLYEALEPDTRGLIVMSYPARTL